MWGNKSVNKMTKSNAMASTIIQYKCRVNKNNNNMKYTGTSDENHCACYSIVDTVAFLPVIFVD